MTETPKPSGEKVKPLVISTHGQEQANQSLGHIQKAAEIIGNQTGKPASEVTVQDFHTALSTAQQKKGG